MKELLLISLITLIVAAGCVSTVHESHPSGQHPPPPSPAADLIIEDIIVSHTVAHRIDFIYTIRNQGNVSAGSSTSLLTIDGKQLGLVADDIEPLAAGESRQEWFPEFDYNCTCILDTLTVQADAYNTVLESNEENNERSEALFCWSLAMKADLVVTDIIRSGSTISYTIKNQGNYVAGACNSFLYIDNVIKDAHNYPPLDPGASSTVSFSYEFICNPGSTYQVKVHVNPQGYCEEGNYYNNERVESFICLIMPPRFP
ncbi:CARDB domain-containing protein [Chloroflexota bacterium]